MLAPLSNLISEALSAVDSGSQAAIVALYVIAALEEIGVPFPFVMDTVLYYHGFSIGSLWKQVIALIFALLLGRLLGASVVYWVSRIGLGKLFRWLAQRHQLTWAWLLRFKEAVNRKVPIAVAAARLSAEVPAAIGFARFFSSSPVAVAFARLTPGLLTATSVASGMLSIRYVNFVLGITVASLFADTAIVTLGAIMGYGYRFFGLTFPPLYAIGGMVAMGGLMVLVWTILSRRRKHRRDG